MPFTLKLSTSPTTNLLADSSSEDLLSSVCPFSAVVPVPAVFSVSDAAPFSAVAPFSSDLLADVSLPSCFVSVAGFSVPAASPAVKEVKS